MRRYLEFSVEQLALLVTLALASGVGVAMFVARDVYSGAVEYRFLVWNLFLAWIPLGFAWLVHVRDRDSAVDRARRAPILKFAPLLFAWLVFLPNAPYIVTDFVHLRARGTAPFWFDLLLILTFAWNGMILGFVSVHLVQDFVQRRYGEVIGWLACGVALYLGAFGVYLGRYERWNSWDLILRPHALIGDVIGPLADPLGHARALAITASFGTFLMLAYATLSRFVAIGRRASLAPAPVSGRVHLQR